MTEKDATPKSRASAGLWITGSLILFAALAGVWSATRDETSVLIVTSNPANAEIVLNYRPTGVSSNAMFTGLPADSFIISLRMDGQRPIPLEQGVHLLPKDTTRIHFFMDPIARGDSRELPRDTGSPYKWQWRIVRLDSQPQGAEIVIEDQKSGVMTPATVLFEAGTHHLQAHWPNGAKSYKNLYVDETRTQPNVMFLPATYQQADSVRQGG